MDSPIAPSYPSNQESSRTAAAAGSGGGMPSISVSAGAGGGPVEGFSASNSTVSSPPDPQTPPAAAPDLYAPTSYNESFASLGSDATTTTNTTTTGPAAHYADQHQQHQHPHSHQLHHQQQQQQSHHAYAAMHGGPGVADESIMGGGRLHPPSPGYPLQPVPSSVPHSLNSSAANSPPKDFLPQLQQQQQPQGAAGDYGYGLPPPQANPIDMVRHGSFSSVASSSGYDYTGAGAAGGDDNGPPALEKAPPEVTGAFHHPWGHHSSSESPFHSAQPPQHPPTLPHHSAGIPAPHHPVQQQQHQPPQYPPSRRGSFLEDLYTPSHSPSSHEFPASATHHHIPPPHHHHHPHQHQQQDVSPLSRPLSDLAPVGLGPSPNQQQQQQQAPLPRISTQFDDASWPPATVSPEMTQHQPTSDVSPTTTLHGPYANSSVAGGEYNPNNNGGGGGGSTGSGSATPQQGMFHHSHTPQPPFARRFSSPVVGGPNRGGYEAGGSGGMTIGASSATGAGAPTGGSPHSFPSLGHPDPSHMATSSFGGGNFAFRPPPLYDDGQDMSDRFEGVANGPASHTMTRHPSLPHLSSMAREPLYQGQQQQLSHHPGSFMSPNDTNSPPSLADSRYAHRSNSLPSSALLLNPLQLTGSQQSTHSPPQLHHAPTHSHTLFPHQQHRSVSLSKQHPQMAPPVGPIMHTDDAASKETANLRRKCYNCQTTEPPSWRRSTLTPGKIVCNRCGLYERTHLRPRPCGTGGELRKASVSMAAAAAAAAAGRAPSAGAGCPPSLAPSPYTTSPVNSKTGAPVRTSKKAVAAMAAMGIQQHTPPPLQQQHPHHVPQQERSLSHSFAAAPEWEDSKNVLVPQHHHQQHYAMPPIGGVPEMSLRPLAHAHSIQ